VINYWYITNAEKRRLFGSKYNGWPVWALLAYAQRVRVIRT
jgi:hypothetical protein